LTGKRAFNAVNFVKMLGDKLAQGVDRVAFYYYDDIVRTQYGIRRFDTVELLKFVEYSLCLAY
jgi:hypothetical protein